MTVAEKKLFKEAFNTDKARLHKRQQKFQKEPNFLIIMEDNILGPGAATSGKIMVYGQGKIKESFLSGNPRVLAKIPESDSSEYLCARS